MEDHIWTKKRPPRIRAPREEEYDRHGRWVRQFSVRTEVWPIFEHWASENGYYLVAMKSGKRLYQKGDNDKFFISLLEIRQFERRVTLTCWVNVGWVARILSLFRIGPEMTANPEGFWGVRYRRSLCRELNVLLERLRQPSIFGSNHFHFADLDYSTVGFIFATFASLAGYLAFVIPKLEVRAGLTNPLLILFGRRGLILLIAAPLLIFLHYFLESRYLKNIAAKLGSAAGFASLFVVLTVVLATKTNRDLVEGRIAHHCVMDFNAEKCNGLVQKLSEKDRIKMIERINQLQKELSLAPKNGH